jgi:FkbM family methyltransferase
MLCQVTRNLYRCIKVNAVLGEKVGYASFFLKKPFDGGAHVEQSTTKNTLRVRTITVDTLFATLNIDHVNYFIIDCEGAELNILEDSEKTLKKKVILNLLIEMHNSQLIKQTELPFVARL